MLYQNGYRGRGTQCVDRSTTNARPGSLDCPPARQIDSSGVRLAFSMVRRRLLGTRMPGDSTLLPVVPIAQGSDAMTSLPGPLICVMIPCYSEQGNIGPLYERIVAAFAAIPGQSYCLLFIDNASTDGTVEHIK